MIDLGQPSMVLTCTNVAKAAKSDKKFKINFLALLAALACLAKMSFRMEML